MSFNLDKVAAAVMAVAAVLMAGKYLTIDAEAGRQRTRDSDNVITVAAEARWGEVRALSLGSSPKSPPLEIIEFIDLEWPFCAKYQDVLDSMIREFGDSVVVRYVNMPIDGHRFAKSGAAATECAFRSGIGDAFIAFAYAHQDSIGFWNWPAMASKVGLSDTTAFADCMKAPETHQKVSRSVSLARSMDIPGTPALMMSTWRYNHAPPIDRLISDARRLLKGEKLQ